MFLFDDRVIYNLQKAKNPYKQGVSLFDGYLID